MASPKTPHDEILSRVRDEIRKGQYGPAENKRLESADTNRDYARGNFPDKHLYLTNLDARAERSVPVMCRVADVLSQDLYRRPPQRAIPGMPGASEFLTAVYRAEMMDARWQQADRGTCVNQVVALEVFGRTGPGSGERPVGVRLWTADSFAVYSDPDDPLNVIALALIDKFDEQKRIRLWTHAGRETWLSPKLAPGQTSGGREMRQVKFEPNPYRAGPEPDAPPVLPFAFAWWRFPDDSDFWCGSPGDGLRLLNFHVNHRLTKNADDIIHSRPIGVIEGTRANFNLPQNRKAGEFYALPPVEHDVATTGPKPELRYVICDLGYLGSDWDDLDRYMQAALEMNGVPLSAVRLEQARAESGVQVISEQIPVLLFSDGRRQPFTFYERGLARVLFQVAASHAENNGMTGLVDAQVSEMWEAVSASGDMQVIWPAGLMEQMKSSDWQRQQFRLTSGILSKQGLIREVEGVDDWSAKQLYDKVVEEKLYEMQAEAQLKQLEAEQQAQGMAIQNEVMGPVGGEPAATEDEPAPAPEDDEAKARGDTPEGE